MGQRANIIVVEQGRRDTYYTHWRANSLPCDLFWGPIYSTAFARAQRPVPGGELFDDVWAEGGAVIDLDNQILLLFGGEDLLYEVPLRRLFLRLLKNGWPGWDVRWAYEGVCDIADYLGLPRAAVLSRERPVNPKPRRFTVDETLRLIGTVASVKFSRGQLGLFPTRSGLEYNLSPGPGIIEMNRIGGVADYKAVDRVPMSGGFHIDETRQTVDFWTTSVAPNIVPRVVEWWPGWNVIWHQDRFEFQIERTDRRFDVSVPADEALLARIREILLREEKEDAVEGFLQVTRTLAKEGMKITDVNPHALRDARLTLPLELRAQMVEAAIAGL
jgi:hypothetical protein